MKLNFKNILFLFGVFVFAFGLIGVSNVGAADTTVLASYRDLNTGVLEGIPDGKIDSILVHMDENVTACNFEAGDWAITVAGDIGLASITNINCLGTNT
ncbi:MAG: hypothetical protein PHT84_04510, partial [Candidatus Pacebacteria bacterium]|nr:hypothetical protein [Candidatus Paceibacterota bacterium]